MVLGIVVLIDEYITSESNNLKENIKIKWFDLIWFEEIELSRPGSNWFEVKEI